MAFNFTLIPVIAGFALLGIGVTNAVRSSKKKEKIRKTFTPEERYHRYLINLKERTPVKTPEERLRELGYTPKMIDEMRQDAIRRNYRDGKYHSDYKAKFGSVDNPEVVGIPECSDSLQFSLEKKHWVLTDGLGNGWIR